MGTVHPDAALARRALTEYGLTSSVDEFRDWSSKVVNSLSKRRSPLATVKLDDYRAACLAKTALLLERLLEAEPRSRKALAHIEGKERQQLDALYGEEVQP